MSESERLSSEGRADFHTTYSSGGGERNDGLIYVRLELIAVKLEKEEVETVESLRGRVKTCWTYLDLPIPQPTPTSIVLPPYFQETERSPLFLFLEFWKSGNILGLVEVNLSNVTSQLIKWIPIRSPIENKNKGKALLSLHVILGQGKVKSKPSSYFPIPTPPTGTNLKQSSPNGERNTDEASDSDIILLLNGKLDSLNMNFEKSKEVRKKGKNGELLESLQPLAAITSSSKSPPSNLSTLSTSSPSPSPNKPKPRRRMGAVFSPHPST